MSVCNQKTFESSNAHLDIHRVIALAAPAEEGIAGAPLVRLEKEN